MRGEKYCLVLLGSGVDGADRKCCLALLGIGKGGEGEMLPCFAEQGWGRVVRETTACLALLTRPRGYKTFFMLNSTEHEIFPARKC